MPTFTGLPLWPPPCAAPRGMLHLSAFRECTPVIPRCLFLHRWLSELFSHSREGWEQRCSTLTVHRPNFLARSHAFSQLSWRVRAFMSVPRHLFRHHFARLYLVTLSNFNCVTNHILPPILDLRTALLFFLFLIRFLRASSYRRICCWLLLSFDYPLLIRLRCSPFSS